MLRCELVFSDWRRDRSKEKGERRELIFDILLVFFSANSYPGEIKIIFKFYEKQPSGGSHAIMDPAACVDCRRLRFVRVPSRLSTLSSSLSLPSNLTPLSHLLLTRSQEEGIRRWLRPSSHHPGQGRSSTTREQEENPQRTIGIASHPRIRDQAWLVHVLQETCSCSGETVDEAEDVGGREETSDHQGLHHDDFDGQGVQVSRSLSSSLLPLLSIISGSSADPPIFFVRSCFRMKVSSLPPRSRSRLRFPRVR